MGIISAIGSIVSSVGSFISGAVSSIGSAIGSFAKNMISVVAKLPIPGISDIARVIEVVGKIANVISAVANVLGLNTEDDPTVLGAKAAQCDKKPENFESTEAYINHLRNNVKLDKEKFEEMTPEEKLGCTAIGTAIYTKGVEEKLGGIDIPVECMGTIAKAQESGITLDPKTIVAVIKALKEAGITNMEDISDCIEGKGDSDRLKTSETIEEALGKDGAERMDQLESAVRQYEEAE